jgi:hypothetical protein
MSVLVTILSIPWWAQNLSRKQMRIFWSEPGMLNARVRWVSIIRSVEIKETDGGLLHANVSNSNYFVSFCMFVKVTFVRQELRNLVHPADMVLR